MKQYLELLQYILDEGEIHQNRTGVDTLSVWGPSSIKIDIQDGNAFPLLTTKYVSFRTVLRELFWFLSGSDKIADLHKYGIKIWDVNFYDPKWQKTTYFEEGSVGLNYGVQWKHWKNFRGFNEARYEDGTYSINQIENLLENIRKDPFSRRHIVTAWHPGETDLTCLPPCHVLFQVKIHSDGFMSLSFLMRSLDVFLGAPFNIASYAALLLMLARSLGYKAKYIVMHMNDAHIYTNHINQVREQLQRIPYALPQVQLEKKDFWSYTVDDFHVKNYKYYPALKAPIN